MMPTMMNADYQKLLKEFLDAEDKMLDCWCDPEKPHPAYEKRRTRAANLATDLRALARSLGGGLPADAEYHLGKNFGLPRDIGS